MRHAFDLRGVEHPVWLGHRTGDGWRLHLGEREAPTTAAGVPAAVAPHADRPTGEPAAQGLLVDLQVDAHGQGRVMVNGVAHPVTLVVQGDTVHLHLAGETYALEHRHPLARAAAEAHGSGHDEVRAPMPGTVIALHTRPGAQVSRGDALLVIESMKLETTLSAPRDGVVRAVPVEVSQVFERDAVLVSFEP